MSSHFVFAAATNCDTMSLEVSFWLFPSKVPKGIVVLGAACKLFRGTEAELWTASKSGASFRSTDMFSGVTPDPKKKK